MYSVRIIADSISQAGARLTTMQITFPRFILAEFNTHRAFSRNSASSRAIPVAKRIAEVRENPFVPQAFTANQKGMQGGEPIQGEAFLRARAAWLSSATYAADMAEEMSAAGVHKQYANRVLEPFLWHTVVVSSTGWQNFFNQRCHPDAQPEIHTIAEMMRAELEASIPQKVTGTNAHLPYIMDGERDLHSANDLERIAVARCARVSYRTNTDDGSPGKIDPVADLALFDRLVKGNHWSPFEHVAKPLPLASIPSGNFSGWYQLREDYANGNAEKPEGDK